MKKLISTLILGTLLAGCGGRYIDDADIATDDSEQQSSITCDTRKVLAYAFSITDRQHLYSTTENLKNGDHVCLDNTLYSVEAYEEEVIIVIIYSVKNGEVLEQQWSHEHQKWELSGANVQYDYIVSNQARYTEPEIVTLLKIYEKANHYKLTEI